MGKLLLTGKEIYEQERTEYVRPATWDGLSRALKIEYEREALARLKALDVDSSYGWRINGQVPDELIGVPLARLIAERVASLAALGDREYRRTQ